ncbi:MAG: tRNA (N6-isopentenyl adenosine(37)-C2)-methylthiotransferase MiaB [Deltaproteobacteria bacterium]|nr:tRNA (N6-isopentenyl adenosine(37)-C2)-methylthiotransferase MiaB [Deltaproteobacteria bacterium]
MKVFVQTFGCQMNVHDSGRIREIMRQAGYEPTDDPGDADVAIVNSCSIREKARHKAISAAGRLRQLKRRRTGMKIVFAGCVAEQDGASLFDLLPGIDAVIGPDHYAALPGLVAQAGAGGSPVATIGFDNGGPDNFLAATPGPDLSDATAFVTVMKGCEERCAYCIVPQVRGPERHRPLADIVEEARMLVGRGVREITLLGQKVNSYRSGDRSFTDLIEALDGVSGLSRIRFTSPHPRHMDDRLIRAFGRVGTLCEAIHIPVQSGSNGVLKRMGRAYTVERFVEIADALRDSCPGILISTDLIVGFPGETVTDFEDTLRLIERVRFSGVFSFKYSPRPGTPSSSLADDVVSAEKARRLAAVHEVTTAVERGIRESFVGKALEVLVDGEGRIPGQLSGRARNNQIVNFAMVNGSAKGETRGRLVQVEVTQALPHCLEGRA